MHVVHVVGSESGGEASGGEPEEVEGDESDEDGIPQIVSVTERDYVRTFYRIELGYVTK